MDRIEYQPRFYFLFYFVLWKFFGNIKDISDLGKLLAIGVILLHPLVLSEALTNQNVSDVFLGTNDFFGCFGQGRYEH